MYGMYFRALIELNFLIHRLYRGIKVLFFKTNKLI